MKSNLKISKTVTSATLPTANQSDLKVTQFEENLNALLADLQNTVPGSSLNHTNSPYGGSGGTSSVPGYGSLNGVRNKPQSPTVQVQKQVYTESRSPVNFTNGSPYNNGSLSRSSLPRTTTSPYQHQQSNTGNLSELDSLLQDLSNARYGSGLNGTPGASSPSPYISDSMKRPSVDSLLDELSNANNTGPVYAVPNGRGTLDSNGKPARHVTITVRETKTERIRGTPSPQLKNQMQIESEIMQTKAPAPYASSATKELDDLMNSLSDFKINSSSHQQQTITDYAKPNKGISHFQTTVVTEETTTAQPKRYQHSGDQLDTMLGSLQTEMSRQGVNTTQKGCCNACDKPIVGQVITALGKTWHPEHFTCNHCNQELGTRNFFERDGHPYCEPDYHNLFSPRCAYCNGPILDKCVTALEKTWHTEHFFCAQCGNQFGEEGFHERDGKPYCRTDYYDMFAPKCAGCNRAIMENYISALNSQWHPDCFVCRDCKQAVTGKSFYAMEGKPVCPGCAGVEDED